MPRNEPVALLQGSLDLLILKTLSWEPMHGFGIARWLHTLTAGELALEEGALYPALYRMANKGWISADWRVTENNRRAKYYTLTTGGRRHLAAESAAWMRFARVMAKVLRTTEQPV